MQWTVGLNPISTQAVAVDQPLLLHAVGACSLLGARFLEVVSGALNRWTNHLVPQWNPYIPKVSASDTT
jgi:hypothetical protein